MEKKSNSKKGIIFSIIAIVLIGCIAYGFYYFDNIYNANAISTNAKSNTKYTVSGSSSTTPPSSTSNSSSNFDRLKSITYKINEEAYLVSSDQSYSITITGIKEVKERNKFSDKNPAQVFLIDYTYRNILGNELYISEYDFTIIDQNGEVGDTYPNSISNYPKRIPEGTTCKAQMFLCVNNNSDKITLQYKDNMFQDNVDMIFELDV